MRTTIYILSLLALSSGLRGQQTYNVTPETLAGWIATDADMQALSQQKGLSLPAGSQLKRSFTASDIGLKVTTTLTLGKSAEEWPVLEIGNAAILFARHGSAGNLVLVVGESAPVELPLGFNLNGEGRSVTPLLVNFSRHGEMVKIGLAGLVLQFSAKPGTESATDVVLSAGATEAWDFQQLEVTVGVPDPVNGARDQSAGASGSTIAASKPSAGTEPTSSDGSAATFEKVTALVSGQAAAKPAGTPARKATLEIFTSPAVRHGRAAAIRAAAQLNGN